MKRILYSIVLLIIPIYAHADVNSRMASRAPVQIDCAPLNPPRQPSEQVTLRAKAEIDSLVKKLLSGSFDVGGDAIKKDLLASIPNADKVLEKQMRAYLLCLAMKQNPERSPELLTFFLSDALPTYGQSRLANSVIKSHTFPKQGRLSLSSQEANVFDNGAIVFDITIDMVNLNEQGRRAANLNKSDSSLQPEIGVLLTYEPRRGTSQQFESTFFLRQTKKFQLGNRRFALTLTDIYEGTSTAEFLVQHLK